MAEDGRDAGGPSRNHQNFRAAAAKDGQIASFAAVRKSLLDQFHHFLHANPTAAPVIVLLISLAVFGAIAPNFFTPFNLSLIMAQVAIIGILGSAQTLVILTAGIDLSVAAIMVFAYMIMARLAVEGGLPTPFAILVGILVGIAAGLFNGAMVTRAKLLPIAVAMGVWAILFWLSGIEGLGFLSGLSIIWIVPIGIILGLATAALPFGLSIDLRLPPFIATLGAWSIFYAFNLWYSESQTVRSQDIDNVAPTLKFFGQRVEILGAQFTLATFLMIAIFAALWYALNWTPWGRSVYAVGDDKEAAELSGIKTDRVLISVYAVAGFLCALGGWAAIGRVGSAAPQSFYEGNLDAITAVVIGGTSLFGGRGAIFGTLFGALIVGVFRSGLKLAGVDVLWQTFSVGLLIIVAVAMDQWIRRVAR